MSIDVSCPQCQKSLQVREEYAGQSLLCPRCSTSLVVPAASTLDRLASTPAIPQRQARSLDDDEPSSGYKPCPQCGGRRSERVTFTFWGSFYGPALLCHVQCPDCNTAYNGRTGRSNIVGIVTFVTVPLMLIVGIIGLLVLFFHYFLA